LEGDKEVKSFDRSGFRRVRFIQSAALAGLLLLASACATPIGVQRASTQQLHYELTASVLSAGKPSAWSRQVLDRNKLVERFDADAEATLAELRNTLTQQVAEERLQDRRFALSELSFLYAEKSGKGAHYLASAVYAYAFLFPEDGSPEPNPLDPRRRLAADLYNRGLTRGLASADGQEVILEERTLSLPFGELTLSVEPSGFLWGGFRFKRFIPVGEFEIRGLRNRYRQAGIGAPLAAELEPVDSGPGTEAARKRIAPRTRVPVTAFAWIANPRRAIVEGKLQGRIEVYAADEFSTVKVDEREVPLELEPTAALAFQLEGAPVWDFEFAGFRVADPQQILGDGLVMMHPYRKGRIPVVLVHGTASSPVRWAEMYNELMNDPSLRGRYQFWLFQYNTGQPILYSALLLRRALTAAMKDVDPTGADAALRRMVIIGHSQGGLLTRLMVTHSGNRFWENASDLPFEQVQAEMKPDLRDLVRAAVFFEPFPAVDSVVFISTPHHGSYRATGWALDLVRWLITMPGTMFSQFQDFLKQDAALGQLKASRLPNSVENMSPGHPFLRALNDLPIDSHVTAHSIIAVLGDWPLIGSLIGRNDGVVAYESAHLDGVASEFIVHSGHSTQAEPETINEVRRILIEHLKAP
jgi:pimeloyl-ACP methyl ester carboxylesterase